MTRLNIPVAFLLLAALATGLLIVGDAAPALAQAPAAPTDVGLARNDKHNELVVSWTAPAGASGVDQWQIECNAGNTFDTNANKRLSSPLAQGDLAYQAGRSYSWTCTGLTADTKYYARVRAISGSQSGAWGEGPSAGVRVRSVVAIKPVTDPIIEGADAVFRVTLDPAPNSDVDVTVTVRRVVQSHGVSVGDDRTASFSSDDSSATVTFATVADDNDATDGIIEVRVHPAPTGYAKGEPNTVTVTVKDAVTGTDYDSDDDGLIDVDSLAKLDAIRYDLDGDGAADDAADSAAYAGGFPSPVAGMGCPTSGCAGYELTADLDFDTNGNNTADSGDAYWNGGKGWAPIAGEENIGPNDGFRTTLEGNGSTISNLFIDRASSHGDGPWDGYRVALFGASGSDAVFRNLNLADVDVTGGEEVGALAGITMGEINGVSVTGSVTGDVMDVGGVVGLLLRGSVVNSGFDGTVSSTASHTGGLVGSTVGGSIRHSYAKGSVTATTGFANRVGGLAGSNGGVISASYAANSVSSVDGWAVGGFVGMNGGYYLRGRGSIIASYSSGDVSGGSEVGGLVGENHGSVDASYSTGALHRHGTVNAAVGGLVGRNEWINYRGRYATATNSVWNVTTSFIFGIGAPDDANYNNTLDSGETNSVPRNTLAELQSPTGYTGIYLAWNVDVDGDDSVDNPWCFGSNSVLPSLRVAEHDGSCPAGGTQGAEGARGAQGDSGDPEPEQQPSSSSPIAGFTLLDGDDGAVIQALTDGATLASGLGKLEIRADLASGESVGSMHLVLSGPTSSARIENWAPYELFGGHDGQGQALAAGSYTLTATPYTEHGGNGEALPPLSMTFTVPSPPPASPPIAGFTLLDGDDGTVIQALTDGATLASGLGKLEIRADLASGETVGSVHLVLSGPTSSARIENWGPYELFGGQDGAGQALAAGSYTLTATPYTGHGSNGEALPPLTVTFTVQ